MLTVSFQIRDIYMYPCLFEVLIFRSVSVSALTENFTTGPDYVMTCYMFNIRPSICCGRRLSSLIEVEKKQYSEIKSTLIV